MNLKSFLCSSSFLIFILALCNRDILKTIWQIQFTLAYVLDCGEKLGNLEKSPQRHGKNMYNMEEIGTLVPDVRQRCRALGHNADAKLPVGLCAGMLWLCPIIGWSPILGYSLPFAHHFWNRVWTPKAPHRTSGFRKCMHGFKMIKKVTTEWLANSTLYERRKIHLLSFYCLGISSLFSDETHMQIDIYPSEWSLGSCCGLSQHPGALEQLGLIKGLFKGPWMKWPWHLNQRTQSWHLALDIASINTFVKIQRNADDWT